MTSEGRWQTSPKGRGQRMACNIRLDSLLDSLLDSTSQLQVWITVFIECIFAEKIIVPPISPIHMGMCNTTTSTIAKGSQYEGKKPKSRFAVSARSQLTMGQNPVPVNIPIPTNMGEFTYQAKWNPKTVWTHGQLSELGSLWPNTRCHLRLRCPA